MRSLVVTVRRQITKSSINANIGVKELKLGTGNVPRERKS